MSRGTGGGGSGMGIPIATAVVVAKIDDRQFDAGLALIRKKLQSLNMPAISIGLSKSAVQTVLQQIAGLKKVIQAPVHMNVVGPGVGAASRFNPNAFAWRGGVKGPNNAAAARAFGINPGAMQGSIGAGLAAGAAVGVGMAGARMVAGGAETAVRSAIAMEASLANIGRLAGYDKQQLSELRSAFEDISTSKGGAPMEELFAIAGFGARTGLGTEGLQPAGLIEFTKAMAKVHTVIDDIPVEQLASEMAKIQNVFKISAQYSEGLASGLLKLDTMSAATADEILNITQRMSGFAGAVGLTLPQVMALAATMKDVGLPVEAGSTAMMRILTKLDTGGMDMAKNLGIPGADFQQAMSQGPLSGLKLILNALDKIDDKGEKIRTIFGKEGLGLHNMRDIAALTQLGAKMGDVQSRAEIVAGEIVSKESIERGVAAKAATTEKTLERLQESFLNLAAALGDPLLGPIRELSDAMNVAASWLKDKAKSGGGGGFTRSLISSSPLLGALLGAGDVSNFMKGDTPAAAGVKGFFGNIWENAQKLMGMGALGPGGLLIDPQGVGAGAAGRPARGGMAGRMFAAKQAVLAAMPEALQAQAPPRPIRADPGDPIGNIGRGLREIGAIFNAEKHKVPGGPFMHLGQMMARGGEIAEFQRKNRPEFNAQIMDSGLDVGRRIQQDILEQFSKDQNDPNVRKGEEIRQELIRLGDKLVETFKGLAGGGPAVVAE